MMKIYDLKKNFFLNNGIDLVCSGILNICERNSGLAFPGFARCQGLMMMMVGDIQSFQGVLDNKLCRVRIIFTSFSLLFFFSENFFSLMIKLALSTRDRIHSTIHRHSTFHRRAGNDDQEKGDDLDDHVRGRNGQKPPAPLSLR